MALGPAPNGAPHFSPPKKINTIFNVRGCYFLCQFVPVFFLPFRSQASQEAYKKEKYIISGQVVIFLTQHKIKRVAENSIKYLIIWLIFSYSKEPNSAHLQHFTRSHFKTFFNDGGGIIMTEKSKIRPFWGISESQISKFSSTIVKIRLTG